MVFRVSHRTIFNFFKLRKPLYLLILKMLSEFILFYNIIIVHLSFHLRFRTCVQFVIFTYFLRLSYFTLLLIYYVCPLFILYFIHFITMLAHLYPSLTGRCSVFFVISLSGFCLLSSYFSQLFVWNSLACSCLGCYSIWLLFTLVYISHLTPLFDTRVLHQPSRLVLWFFCLTCYSSEQLNSIVYCQIIYYIW